MFMTGDITTTPVYQGGGLTATSAQALVNDGLGEYLKSCSGFITSLKKNLHSVSNWKVSKEDDYGSFWDEVKNKNCFFWKTKQLLKAFRIAAIFRKFPREQNIQQGKLTPRLLWGW